MLKIWRSQYSKYGHSPEAENELYAETYTADAVYTDAELKYIADGGFNGIWLNMLLHNVVKHSSFPEFGLYAEEQQAKLSSLIARAAKYGIKVYLCCQPPRAVSELDTTFWKNHGDVAGAAERLSAAWGCKGGQEYTNYISLCTSLPKVQQYIREAFAELSRALPELGGYILITASEYPAHCRTYPHKNGWVCPRCSKRTPEEVIAEVINLAAEGVHSTAPEQKVIAWNWSWRCAAGALPSDIIRRLDKSVIVMGDAERGGCDAAGTYIDEYAMCYPGPAPLFLEDMSAAEANGLGTAAKLQLNVTHELASVPNIPVPGQLFARAQWVKHSKCSQGYMGCWNFGNAVTGNTAAFHYFCSQESPDTLPEALQAFAEKYFPGCDAAKVAAGWQAFGDALYGFPHHSSWLYMGCTNWALGYFCPPGKMVGKGGRSWQYDERGDDFSEAFAQDDAFYDSCAQKHPFTAADVSSRFSKISERWSEALKIFEQGLANCNDAHAVAELNTAKVAAACFASANRLIKLYIMKRDKGSAEGEEYLALQRAELETVREILPIVESDKRQGFHSEAQVYMFDAAALRRKLALLEALFK